ncbi:Mediator complex, subunit Med18 [Niveomyces insectorum RCEF 264]|uniref:Mediator of RNA polymerase II transcription subunit 18 n=1 Tax=Niveomyces insectorum RCEF 264 TaxID=1081102 RepID=A0A162MBF7_9HYPO|nr:Mediator complex, subunit Med18 [Niveomyces insectorum RCEF 264]
MHELFLTAVVPDAELERAKALLQGLSGMAAYASIQRVLYFAGPPQPRGLVVRRSLPTPLLPTQVRLWSELHQQLSRQSFVVQARYALQPADFGQPPLLSPVEGGGDGPAAVSTARLNSTPGTLRWTDIPDPTPGGGGNRLVMQRKKIEIADTRGLPAILQDNNYRFKAELVEESFAFFANNNEYALVRLHRLPTNPASGAGGMADMATATTVPQPLVALPPWDEVVSSAPTAAALPVDPAGQWLLFVRRHVLDDTSPEKMASALEALDAVRTQLAGAFFFRPVDRRAHDTRIERPVNNMPVPLPQRVRGTV